jgi:hypothetical protein
VWPSYLRVVTGGKPSHVPEGKTVPRIEGSLAPTIPDPVHLARYAALCGVRDRGVMPIAYPHMLAAGMHLAMLASDAFPVRVLGLVHLRNVIVRDATLDPKRPLALRAWIEGHRETDRGQEFVLETEGTSEGVPVWRETSIFLARRKAKPGSGSNSSGKPPKAPIGPTGPIRTASYSAPADIGRRYAGVSGDWNPIHLADFTARPFGFKRAIAHGMWSLARCAAELNETRLAGRVELDISFKLPVMLPAWVVFESADEANGYGFALKDSTASRPYLTGTLRTAAA